MLSELAGALVESAPLDAEGPEPLFLHLPDPGARAGFSDWMAAVLEIAKDQRLVTDDSGVDDLTSLLTTAIAQEVTPGSSGRMLYVLGSAGRSVTYDLVFWRIPPEEGEDAVDTGLLQLIGEAPDPEFGSVEEWITTGAARVRERFHVYAADLPDPEASESPLVWVGGFAAEIAMPGDEKAAVAAVTATTDIGAIIASLRSVTEYISRSDDDGDAEPS